MDKDSIGNTFFVAVALCLVCSAFVALAAVGLRPIQEKNKALDKKKNVLIAAGLCSKGDKIDVAQLFAERIVDRVIELSSGNDVTADLGDQAATFDAEASLQEQGQFILVPPEQDIATLKKRENLAHVYLVKTSASDATPSQYVFPIRGKGLWSTCKGFLAINADLKTASGITYYEDGETPGLGGEINSKEFQDKWPGKVIFGENNEVILEVSKSATSDHQVDALSGATITSKGVQYMIQYWLGPNGYGPYLDQLRSAQTGTQVTAQ